MKWVHGSLTARIVAINGLVFALGTALLALSPATVSEQPLFSEVVVLAVGLGLMVLGNGALVGRSLRPLDRLVVELEATRGPGVGPTDENRLTVPGDGIAHDLAEAVNDLLARVEQAQRESKLHALAAQEAERARVAQDLHDGVGQSLTALLLEVGKAAEEHPEISELEVAREDVREVLTEVRDVARRLRPHVLEDLGLRSALVALTTDLFQHTDVHVRRGITPGLPAVDEAVELVVFRVAQEALTNVLRHAAASTVEVTLGTAGGDLMLQVADDGRGIPAGAEGTGIRGMRERAGLVDGELEVRRRDGGGTEVVLAVPLARRAPRGDGS